MAETVKTPLRMGSNLTLGHMPSLLKKSVDELPRNGPHGGTTIMLQRTVEFAEHVLLDHHVLVDRLDDEIAIGQDAEIEPGAKQPHARLDVGCGHPTLLGRIVVVAPDRGHAAFQRILLCLDDRHWNSGIEEVHRDAAAHGAGADHPHLSRATPLQTELTDFFPSIRGFFSSAI